MKARKLFYIVTSNKEIVGIRDLLYRVDSTGDFINDPVDTILTVGATHEFEILNGESSWTLNVPTVNDDLNGRDGELTVKSS